MSSQTLESALQHFQSGRLQEAFNLGQSVLASSPAAQQQLQALELMGLVALKSGQYELSIALNTQAINLNPNLTGILNNMGNAHKALGQIEQAIEFYQRALKTQPRALDTIFNLGNAYLQIGNSEQAISHFEKALKIDPSYFNANFQLGTLYKGLKQFDKAERYYLKASHKQPDHYLPYRELGLLHWECGRIEEAKQFYQKAIDASQNNGDNPSLKNALTVKQKTLCPIIPHSTTEITTYRNQLAEQIQQWQNEKLKLSLADALDCDIYSLFYLNNHGLDDLPLKKQFAQFVTEAIPEINQVNDLVSKAPKRQNPKPKIGFLVTDTHEGIFCRYLAGFLKHHNAELIDVSILGSQICCEKIKLISKLESLQTTYLPDDIFNKLNTIANEHYDVLFYFEYGTDTTNYLLPFFRLAPVQLTSVGQPVTSGISTMDYWLSSRYFESETADQHYNETLLRFDSLPTYFEKPGTRDLITTNNPKTRADFNLPEDKTLYCCYQRLCKLHSDFDLAMAEILRQDSNGIIVLFEDQIPHWKTLYWERLQASIPEVCDRIIILPRLGASDFHRVLTLCDVGLDSFYFGGGNTTFEVMPFGIPIITLPGEFMRGRMTQGCYEKMGVSDESLKKLVAYDSKHYIDLAVTLGSHPEIRQALQTELLEKCDVLYSDMHFVRELESFFIKATHQDLPLAQPINNLNTQTIPVH